MAKSRFLVPAGLILCGCAGVQTPGWQPGTFETKHVVFEAHWTASVDFDLTVRTTSFQSCGWPSCSFGSFSGDDFGNSGSGDYHESATLDTKKPDEPYDILVENKGTESAEVTVRVLIDGSESYTRSLTIAPATSQTVASYQLGVTHDR